MPATDASHRERRPGRLRRALLALGIGFALSTVVAELCVRWLLLSDSSLARRWSGDLRSPENVADTGSDEYWKLQWVLGTDLREAPGADPEIGWINTVQPSTYAHPDEARLQGRRPVLLFGDSYAQCATRPVDCFQGLLESSELGREYALLNYGVGGYGVDQVYLLLRRVLPRFVAQKPVVVVGVMLDDDFSRSLLGLRCWPKSRASLEDGRLRVESPDRLDPVEYVRAHPVRTLSWAWRLLVYRDGALPRSWQRALRDTGPSIAERVAVNRALLDAIAAELDAAGVEHVFLFFNGEPTLFDEPSLRWTVELARAFERESGQPCVWTLPFLREGTCGDLQRGHPFFGASGPEAGHYNSFGNRMAFEALRQGLLAPRAPPDLERVRQMCESGALTEMKRSSRRFQVLDCPAVLSTYTREPCVRLQPVLGGDGKLDLWLRASPERGTTLELEALGKFQHLSARVERVVDGPSTCVEGAVRMSLELDGAARSGFPVELGPGAQPLGLELPLTGAQRVRIRLELAGASEACGWIVLRDLSLE